MIKNKQKPCKGIGLAKGYGCGKLTFYREKGLGKMCCYYEWYNESENGKIQQAKRKIKPKNTSKESLSFLKQSLVDVCHKYIRLRDKGKPCVSCLSPYDDNHQAGHCFKAELYSTLKYHELNIHGQCYDCNINKDGNVEAYKSNLPKRIGEKDFQELIRLSVLDKKTLYKWDKQWLKEQINYYSEKIQELNH